MTPRCTNLHYFSSLSHWRGILVAPAKATYRLSDFLFSAVARRSLCENYPISPPGGKPVVPPLAPIAGRAEATRRFPRDCTLLFSRFAILLSADVDWEKWIHVADDNNSSSIRFDLHKARVGLEERGKEMPGIPLKITHRSSLPRNVIAIVKMTTTTVSILCSECELTVLRRRRRPCI